MVINHRHTRTGFARPLAAPSGLGLRPRATRPLRGGRISARPDSEWRKRKRRAPVLVCGLEYGAVAHEFRKIAVNDAVALLDGIVAREDVLGVVVAKWQVKGVKFEKLLKNTLEVPQFSEPEKSARP